MKMLRACAFALVVLGCSTHSESGVITFEAVGVPGISGFVQYDSSAFHGFFEIVPNSAIVGLSLTVLGEVFDLADLVNFPGFSAAIIDTSIPRIYNGFGLLADNGSAGIAFYPDGFDGTPTDGDASLSLQRIVGGIFLSTTYPVRWQVAAAPEPSVLALVLVGAAALGFRRRDRRSIPEERN